MQVYTLKIELKRHENKLNRVIEIANNAKVSTLAYSVLSSVRANGSHLFNITYKGNRFEYAFDTEDIPRWMIYHNPSLYDLTELSLSIGDKLDMEYDYGAGWEFILELIDIREMKKGTHRHYPYVISAQGIGIYEGNDPINYDEYIRTNNEIDLNALNGILKSEIEYLSENYEQHITNKKKQKLRLNEVSDDGNVIDFDVKKMWLTIPKDIREMYLTSALCHECYRKKSNSGVFNPDYKIEFLKGMLIIDGTCAGCGGHIRRVCD